MTIALLQKLQADCSAGIFAKVKLSRPNNRLSFHNEETYSQKLSSCLVRDRFEYDEL